MSFLTRDSSIAYFFIGYSRSTTNFAQFNLVVFFRAIVKRSCTQLFKNFCQKSSFYHLSDFVCAHIHGWPLYPIYHSLSLYTLHRNTYGLIVKWMARSSNHHDMGPFEAGLVFGKCLGPFLPVSA